MQFSLGRLCFLRSRILLLLTCSIPLSVCLAQFPGSPLSSGQQAKQSRVLTGTVVNSATGAPIPFALVQAGQQAQLADQSGNFRFDDLQPGPLNLIAHKPGFFNEQDLGETAGPYFGVIPPQTNSPVPAEPANVTLQLIPECVIAGHVTSPEGDSLEGLPVRLRYNQLVNGRRVWQQQGSSSTDEEGNFRIAGLRPGTYYVEVGPNFRARPIQEAGHEKFEVIPAEYYPGARDMSAASPLRLAPGQHASLEMEMQRVPAFRVSGVVTGVPTKFGGLTVADNEGENTNVAMRFNPQTRRFEAFPIAAGSYRLRFNGQDVDGQPVFADVPINVDRDLPELRVAVQRTISIPVEFNVEFTKQNSQPQIVVHSGPPALVGQGPGPSLPYYGQLRLISRTPPYQQFFASREKPDAPMTVRGVEPGTYDVEVDSNGADYVASVTCGGIDLMSQPLVIAEGADPQPVYIVVRDDGASVDGAVLHLPQGQHSVRVLMVADGEDTRPPRQLWVDNGGKFRVQGVAPGSYEILAFDRLDGIEYGNRQALSEYLSRAAHVTLSADEQARVTVDLIRTTD